jgi:hypothetical protein
MPRRIDVLDRQFFGGAGVGFGDVSLGLFPGRLPRGALEAAAFAPELDVDRRRYRGCQSGPVELQIGILRFDRLPDFLRERLAPNFDLRRRPEPEQNPGSGLAGSIRGGLEQVIRFVTALVARDFHVRHSGATPPYFLYVLYFLFWARAGFLVLAFGFGALRAGGAGRAGFFAARTGAGFGATATTGRLAGVASRLRWTSANRT